MDQQLERHARIYENCSCNRCGGKLAWPGEAPPQDAIVSECIRCEACGSKFDWIWGVPYLGAFERADFPSLIEIAANIEAPARFSPESITDLQQLIVKYHAAHDKDQFLADTTNGLAPYIPTRYNEWRGVETLIQGIERKGAKVLDVGAGAGYDAYLHVLAGSEVTAVEFSPILSREGQLGLPMIEWFGGCSHALPFSNASFDIVVANAALHHMRDIPTSIAEMLRVLRPGGWLITSSDSFCTDHAPDDNELNIFNRNPAVLSGVNERVPRLVEFVQALKRFRSKIEPQIYTNYLYGAPQPDGTRADIPEIREWIFDRDLAMLSTLNGAILLKVRKVSSIDEPRHFQANAEINAAEFAKHLSSASALAAHVVRWTPEPAINQPLFQHDKLKLLNGWLKPSRTGCVQGWRRARWYLRRRPSQSSLTFKVRTLLARKVDVLVNGQAAATATLPANSWTRVTLPLEVAPDQPFVVELRLSGSRERFEDDLFDVSGRQFIGSFIDRISSWCSEQLTKRV